MKALSRVGQAAADTLRRVVERLESSEASVQYSFEEMDEHLRGARRGLIQSVAAQRQLADKAARARQAVDLWTRRAELAIRAGDEELAKQALGQKRRQARTEESLNQALDQQREVSRAMKADLEQMDRRLEALRLRAPSLAATAAFRASGGRPESLGVGSGQSSAVEAFSQLEERLDGVDAVFEAQQEVEELLAGGGSSDASLEAKFAALEGRANVAESSRADPGLDEELRQLKTRFRV